MDFELAVKTLNKTLRKENPDKFSSPWILKFAPKVYHYARKNVRTETDHIDWDQITCGLDRKFQGRWTRYRVKVAKLYEDQNEVDLILVKYKDKLYTFIAPQDDKDKKIRDRITISLIRISQRGNVLAQIELVKWLRYTADEWIDTYPVMARWKVYPGAIDDKILHCINHYRYTGSFLGYLYRTLECSGRGLPPACSFDDPVLDGNRTKADYIIPVYD